MSCENEKQPKVKNKRILNKYLESNEKLFIITSILFLVMIILVALLLTKLKENQISSNKVISYDKEVVSSTSNKSNSYSIIDATSEDMKNLDYTLLKDKTKIGQRYRFSAKIPKKSEWRVSPYFNSYTEIEIKGYSFIRVQVTNNLAESLEGEKTTQFIVEVTEKKGTRYLLCIEAKTLESDSFTSNETLSSESTLEPSSESSVKSESTETKKIDLEKYYGAIEDAIKTVNTEAGYDLLEMEKSSETPGIKIVLTKYNNSYSEKELRTIIKALNRSLYKIAKTNGVNSPRFYYVLNGEEVAVNRYIMAPDEVKFSGILK